MSSRDEHAARQHFTERYALRGPKVAAEMERRVIGAVWGANGYTTVTQADELGRRLELRRGDRLLDIGTGRGWPGLYLAVRSGCSVVGTDLPFEALTAAMRRAGREGLTGRASVAMASGRHQPFRPGSFDAVVHTDVLC